MRFYGLSEEEAEALYGLLDLGCGICRKEFPERSAAFLDHNHETGEVRGWLCSLCNIAIGALRDDPLLCEAAAGWLRAGGNLGDVGLKEAG
jgi:hypothetical protein